MNTQLPDNPYFSKQQQSKIQEGAKEEKNILNYDKEKYKQMTLCNNNIVA
jgi:hypothetical protein